jgi:YVTN family beta-propeller protein
MSDELNPRSASLRPQFRALAFLLLNTAASLSALAQIGGPVNVKKVAANPPTPPPTSIARRYEKEGVAVEFSLATAPGAKGGLMAGSDAVATFRVTDTRTGEPLSGLHPNAWFSSLKSGPPSPNEAECKDKIRAFMGGLLSVRPDIDLNSYLAVTLNHDNTISFINPQVAFQITKLESIVVLPGRGADWALTLDKNWLFVSLPEQSAVAVINTVTRKLEKTIALDMGARPRRVALAPDGRRLWVGLDGSPRIAVIDTAERKLLSSVEVGGGGLHSVAFTTDGRFAYVSNSDGESVTAIDARTLRKLADINVGQTPGPIAYSSAGNKVYVATVNGGGVAVIDPAKQAVVANVPVGQGVVALRFEPQGRYAFAVNQKESKLTIIDAATNRAVGSASVVASPDQVVFTSDYAYVRGLGSEKFSLINLKEAADGKPSPVDIQAGRRPPSDSPEDYGVADMIAATPEGGSAMIANAPDATLYYYVQGMMAPMGTLSNYKRRPQALLILDRSLAETGPGVYSTPVRLSHGGRFSVAILVDQPRLINCFDIEIAQSPDGSQNPAGASIHIEPEFKGLKAVANRPYTLRFRVKDTTTGAPVNGLMDVQVLVFQPPGIWQQRQWAKDLGGGLYEVTQTFPQASMFSVMFNVASRGVSYRDLPATDVAVTEGSKEDVKTDAQKTNP